MRKRRTDSPDGAGSGRVGLIHLASRRPGTAALQAVARNPAMVFIHHAGGRPSPAAETKADAEATHRGPRRGGWPRRRYPPQHLGGRGRPPSRRLQGTRRWCLSVTLEGGRPRPPRQRPMRKRRTDSPDGAGSGRVGLIHLASRRPGTAALQAVARNPAMVFIHHAGGRPSPAAERRTDAEETADDRRDSRQSLRQGEGSGIAGRGGIDSISLDLRAGGGFVGRFVRRE